MRTDRGRFEIELYVRDRRSVRIRWLTRVPDIERIDSNCRPDEMISGTQIPSASNVKQCVDHCAITALIDGNRYPRVARVASDAEEIVVNINLSRGHSNTVTVIFQIEFLQNSPSVAAVRG